MPQAAPERIPKNHPVIDRINDPTAFTSAPWCETCHTWVEPDHRVSVKLRSTHGAKKKKSRPADGRDGSGHEGDSRGE